MLDLKIKGKKAIVCAASKGLGRACAMSLGRAGVDLVITARTKETLDATAEEIRRETGAKVAARRRRHRHRGRPPGRARRLPEPRHSGATIAAGRRTAIFPRLVGRGLAKAVNNNMLTPGSC